MAWIVYYFPKSNTGALWKAYDKEQFRTKKEATKHMKSLPNDNVYKVEMEIDYEKSRTVFTMR